MTTSPSRKTSSTSTPDKILGLPPKSFLILLLFIAIITPAVHLTHRLAHPIEKPEIAISLAPSNTASASIGDIKYPTLTGSAGNYSVAFATYSDQFCIDVTPNPAGSYLYGYSLKIDQTYDHQKFFGGTERKTVTLFDSTSSDYNKHSKENPYCFAHSGANAVYSVTAENSAGRTTAKISTSWLDGCSTLGTIKDGDNKWSKCDERSSYNDPYIHPENYDQDGHLIADKSTSTGNNSNSSSSSTSNSNPNNSSSSSSSSSNNSNSSGPTNSSSSSSSKPISSKPTKNSSGLTATTAESLCVNRLERSYELDGIYSSTLNGETWEIELGGLHESSTHDTLVSVECHVTGSNSSPRITQYKTDLYEDYYVNDSGYYEECYFGYDYSTGTCR